MEDSLSARLFADEIMHFFSRKEGVEWSACEGVCDIADEVTPYYKKSVTEAVHTTYKANIDDVLECQEEMLSEGLVDTPNDFARLALEAAPEYFPHGFTPAAFIGFCAMVMGVAHLFSIQRKEQFYLDAASGVVSTVLIGCILCGGFENEGVWDHLVPLCQNFNHAHAALNIESGETRSSKRKDAQKTQSNNSNSVVTS